MRPVLFRTERQIFLKFSSNSSLKRFSPNVCRTAMHLTVPTQQSREANEKTGGQEHHYSVVFVRSKRVSTVKLDGAKKK